MPLLIAILWLGSLLLYALTPSDAAPVARPSQRPATLGLPQAGERAVLAIASPNHVPLAARSPRVAAAPRRATAPHGHPLASTAPSRQPGWTEEWTAGGLRAAGNGVLRPGHTVPTLVPGLSISLRTALHPAVTDRLSPPARALQTARPRLEPARLVLSATGRTVWVTGYDLTGTTASGLPAGPGICAVDPTVIPLGTRISIDGIGTCLAADTGPAVIGTHIDVWVPDSQRAFNLTGIYTAHW
jgi:3D (Asp-Asp-Asp) domain-containing protein